MLTFLGGIPKQQERNLKSSLYRFGLLNKCVLVLNKEERALKELYL